MNSTFENQASEGAIHHMTLQYLTDINNSEVEKRVYK